VTWTADQVKEYVEKILDEHRRATMQAERERELAASALREGIYQSIREGVERLREHVAIQIVQIQTALEAASSLEQQRVANTLQKVEGLRTEMLLLHEGSEKAINKAEVATERRFESVNEFRAQLGDQVQQFIPREVAETQFGQMNQRLAVVEGLVQKGAGEREGVTRSRGIVETQRTFFLGLAGAIMIAIGVAGAIIAAVN
jgi:hypothetical protein